MLRGSWLSALARRSPALLKLAPPLKLRNLTARAARGHRRRQPIPLIAVESLEPRCLLSAPQAYEDWYSVQHDPQLVTGSSGSAEGVLYNDSDPESDPMTATLLSNPTNGSVTFNSDGTFTYTPNANFAGSDSFTYEANDGTETSDPATVHISVMNDAPTASDDSYSTLHDQTLTVDASGTLDNDMDNDGDPLNGTILSLPSNGTLTRLDDTPFAVNDPFDGYFKYIPNAGSDADDSFTYEITDGVSNTTPSTGTVNIEVMNNAPTAAADSYIVVYNTPLLVSAALGVLANDSDPDDGDAVLLSTSAVLDAPDYGTLDYLNSDGSFKFTPTTGYEGSDSFTYRPEDDLGLQSIDSPTVSLSIVCPIVDIDVDSNNNGNIDADDAEDADEDLNPGKIIWRNNDDSDGNGTADRLDSGPYSNLDYDLKPVMVTLDSLGADLTGFTLTFVTTNSRIKLWKSTTKKPLTPTFTIGTDNYPGWIYVEGVDFGDSKIELILRNPSGTEINRASVRILVTEVNFEAYRPQTVPFQSVKVPPSQELVPGIGIRRNGDDDNANSTPDRLDTTVLSGEDDLIRVDVASNPLSAPGIEYVIRRENAAVHFYLSPDKTSPLLTDSTTTDEVILGLSTTFWVEWVSMDPTVTLCAVDLVLRDSVHGTEPFKDTLNFHPFSSVVIVLGGRNQVPTDPVVDPNHGTFLTAVDLYQDGFDVHMYDEDDVGAWFVIGAGAAYDEVAYAVQNRGVSNVAFMGYSYGGGATFNLSTRLSRNTLPVGNPERLTDITNSFTIKFTAYIDAIVQDSIVGAAENRRPPLSTWHLGLYETTDNLRPGTASGGDEDINVNTNIWTQPWGANLNHFDIDDNMNVRDWVKWRFYQRVSR